jgi:hypothetical protein
MSATSTILVHGAWADASSWSKVIRTRRGPDERRCSANAAYQSRLRCKPNSEQLFKVSMVLRRKF